MKQYEKNPINRKSALAYFVIIFSSLFIAITVFFLYTEQKNADLTIDELKYKEGVTVSSASGTLGEQTRQVISDLQFLKKIYELHIKSTKDMSEFKEEWRVFSEEKGIYDQIRFIDKNGDEKIRINYTGKSSYIVDDSLLQNKKDRYYFTETAKLNENQIYISKIDLNIEGDSIELPIKPMIRFCLPVYNSENQFDGIVVLNYLAKNMIDKFVKDTIGSSGQAFLLNSNGYWIYNGDPEKDWTFMYMDKADISFKNSFPNEWETIKSEEGTINTDKGIFTFSNVFLSEKMKNTIDYTSNNIVLDEGDLKVVSFIDSKGKYAYLFNRGLSIETFKKVMIDNFAYYIMIFVVSIAGASIMYLKRKSIFEIKYFSEYDGLTNVLNRRAGFDLLNKSLMSSDSRIGLCFIDINGLKDVNDYLGHEAGDELILTIVNTIKKVIRNEDFVIRMGGDEFIIVLNGSNAEQVEEVWLRVLEEFNRINKQEARPYLVSVSHGVTEIDSFKRSMLDKLINEADEKMYQEKGEIKKNLTILR